MLTFEQYLAMGQEGETVISRWLMRRGNHVLPAYDPKGDNHKGPRMFAPDGGGLVIPDIMGFRLGRSFWVEAKTKTGFDWHRKSGSWTTGLDVRHFRDYEKIQKVSGLDVWVMFLQNGKPTKNSPPPSMNIVQPSGLYCEALSYLRDHVHHEHEGKMLYWQDTDLRRLALLSEVQ